MTVFYDGPGATLIHGDATRLTEYVEPESVDLIVTSPPYFALRSYTDGGEHYDGQIGSEDTPEQFLEALWTVTEQCARVLKPSGSMFINLGDKYAGSKSLMGLPWRYALGCIDGRAGDPLILRAEVIWHKLNGLPESVTDRVRRNHEQWFHFTKEPQYFSGIDEIREQYTAGSAERMKYGFVNSGKSALAGRKDGSGTISGNGESVEIHPLGKLPGSVWSMAMEPLRVPDWLGVDHYAAFPTEWPRKLISGWSPVGFCLECQQPRQAQVEKHTTGHDNNRGKTDDPGRDVRGSATTDLRELMKIKAANPDRITGYACACDDTKAPTRPAVVLDPFGGTGTVAMVARALGRHGLHVDLSTDYLKLAKWRVFESGHWTKAVRKTNEDNQQTLDL
jgi:DNA modification methylase